MFIKNLLLQNFRNYSNERMEFSNDTNIIYGLNAQGKTNILEAIYLCASGRSHRTSKDHELVRFDEKFFRIEMEVSRETREIGIEISYKNDDKKKVKINGIPVIRPGELMGNLNAIIFSPEDLMIIKEGPSERRKFMDISISQVKPSYFYDLQQYAKILQHRNNLLKEIQLKPDHHELLEIWNNKLVEVGSRIMYHRFLFIKKLGPLMIDIHNKITDGKEKIEIRYQPSFIMEKAEDPEQIRFLFEKALEKASRVELMKGSTLLGPQRDDLQFSINDTEVRYFGSQGQQRTSVLSLKLSELLYMKGELGEYPVLLLDDVMSELDQERQKFLLHSLKGIQVFITCTEKESIEKHFSADVSFYHINKGKIIIER